MNRYALVLATLATFLITAVTLHAAGWFAQRPVHPRPLHSNSNPAVDHSTSSIPAYTASGIAISTGDCLGQY